MSVGVGIGCWGLGWGWGGMRASVHGCECGGGSGSRTRHPTLGVAPGQLGKLPLTPLLLPSPNPQKPTETHPHRASWAPPPPQKRAPHTHTHKPPTLIGNLLSKSRSLHTGQLPPRLCSLQAWRLKSSRLMQALQAMQWKESTPRPLPCGVGGGGCGVGGFYAVMCRVVQECVCVCAEGGWVGGWGAHSLGHMWAPSQRRRQDPRAQADSCHA